MTDLDLTFSPLTPSRWDDFADLFGPRGATGGCWCMWWRITNKEFEANKGEGNRMAIKDLVDKGTIPGILAYDGDQAIGWCSVAPREEFTRLERSRILKPVDEQPVWSIVCFFVAKGYRRQGVTVGLLKAAIDYVRQHGGKIVEGYPVEPRQDKMPDPFVYTGLASAFLEAGFKEVLRRSETRPIMRYEI